MNEKSNELIVDINLYRRLREHEDNVMNHRMVWMWTLQALLFAAFSVIWEKGVLGVEAIICLVGILSSISIGLSLHCSWKTLETMKIKGQNYFIKNQGIDDDFLNIILGESSAKVNENFLPWRSLPYVMGGAWVVLFFIYIGKHLI